MSSKFPQYSPERQAAISRHWDEKRAAGHKPPLLARVAEWYIAAFVTLFLVCANGVVIAAGFMAHWIVGCGVVAFIVFMVAVVVSIEQADKESRESASIRFGAPVPPRTSPPPPPKKPNP